MIKIFFLLPFLNPTFAIAGYGEMGGSSEGGGGGGGSGSAVSFVFWSILAGVVVGYLYCIHYNDTHEQKIAADGCMIVGGLIAPFVCLLLFIILR